MFKEFLLLLALGHTVGDFYLQTSKMAKRKNNCWFYFIFHCILYAISTFLCLLPVKGIQLWLIVLVVSGSHMFIDLIKKFLSNTKIDETILFLADQVLHLSVIFGVYIYIIKNCLDVQIRTGFANFFELLNLNYRTVIGISLLLLLNAKPCNVMIKSIMKKRDSGAEQDTTHKGIGAIIGTLERWTIILFFMIEQYSSIGLVLTAKSIARYNKISTETNFAEYYLLGTLTSTIFAVFSTIIIT